MRRNFRVSSFIDSHFLCGIIPSAIKTEWRSNGPVAQWQSSCLLSNLLTVRARPGSPKKV